MKNTRIWLGMAGAALLVALALVALPTDSGAQSNFGTVTLRAGFTPDPHVASGTSGGGQQASQYGSNCRGTISSQPDHILMLQSSFNFLRIFAQSSGDTTLVIRGNGQTWCDDDTYGRNPSVEGSFSPGRYEIWIGSYSSGSNHAYQLKLTELRSVVPDGATPNNNNNNANNNNTNNGNQGSASTAACGTTRSGRPACVNANAPRPNFGCRGRQGCRLRTGFTPDPWRFNLTAGGGADPINVQSLGLSDSNSGSACGRSFITENPDFRFYFEAGTSFDLLRFYVVTRNNADATLLINSPNARWYCNDDHGQSGWGNNLMPAIDFRNPPAGRYDIWVGTYDGSSRNPADFYVTELQSNHP